MMTTGQGWHGDRLVATVGVGLIHAILGYALFAGFSVHISTRSDSVLKLFTVPLPEPPPPERAKPLSRNKPFRQGAASPPNLRSRATEIAVPPAPVFIPLSPPVLGAPVRALGDDRSSGASAMPGPGTGSGGIGKGTGSGRSGGGAGGGGIGPRQIKGRIRNSDYPRPAVEAGAAGTVSVRYTVAADGRVSRCVVTQSSGSADLDGTTCRLIQERFRFEPARDANGKPVQADIVEDHEWIMEHVQDDPPG